MSAELIETLPRLLRELATLHSVDAALRLAEWRGGQTIYIPKGIDAEHPIARRIGSPAAQWLAENYGGENVRIDRAAATLRHLRNQKMIQRSAQGASLNTLADEFDLTQRQVLNILRDRQADPTHDLFE